MLTIYFVNTKARTQQSNQYKRRHQKMNEISANACAITPLYFSQFEAPHCLMELTQRAYSHMQNNYVYICGLSITKDPSSIATNGRRMTHYNYTAYGKNINISHKEVDGNGHEPINRINLCKSTTKIIAMVADKEECLSIIPNTYTISSCLHEMTDDKIKVKMSGNLLLIFAILLK